MECENCGEELEENFNYCPMCGEQVISHEKNHEMTTYTRGGYEQQKVYYKCENAKCSIRTTSKDKFKKQAKKHPCPKLR